MKKILFTICFSLCFFWATAQDRTPATAEQQAMIKAKIAESAQKTNSMTCDFVQTKKSLLLSEEAVSKGKMFYRTANNTATSAVNNIALRWEYEDGYTFIVNNDNMQMLTPEGKPQNSVKMNRFFKEIINTMLIAVNGKDMTDQNKYTATFYVDKNHWYINLIPVQREIKNMFSSIELVFSAYDHTGERVEIIEKSGDKTIITLTNKKLNVKIEEAKFSIK